MQKEICVWNDKNRDFFDALEMTPKYCIQYYVESPVPNYQFPITDYRLPIP
ncbi:hypothetical protein BGP_5030 [Beggiatoa sp. PS]|nr:hypothetical protein BGP_5030 [Beggiatoa sp. PS]